MRAKEPIEQVAVGALSGSRAWARAVVLCSLMAVLTALAAQVRVPLPFTPVPLTLQVFAALLAGGLLGPRLGAASMIGYLGMGACGLPVFSGGRAGLEGLAGPTGGYLAGFVVCAFAVGWIMERGVRSLWVTLAACLAGVALIHVAGWLRLVCWMVAAGGAEGAAARAFAAGVVPFVGIDLVKAVGAAFVIREARRRSC